MNLAALLPSPPGGWRLWGVIAGVALVGFLFWRTYESGKSDGVAQERSSWEAVVREAEDRAQAAELALLLDVAERREQAQKTTYERERVTITAREEIASAESLDARLAAYRNARERLRNSASEHLSRAINAYDVSRQSE